MLSIDKRNELIKYLGDNLVNGLSKYITLHQDNINYDVCDYINNMYDISVYNDMTNQYLKAKCDTTMHGEKIYIKVEYDTNLYFEKSYYMDFKELLENKYNIVREIAKKNDLLIKEYYQLMVNDELKDEIYFQDIFDLYVISYFGEQYIEKIKNQNEYWEVKEKNCSDYDWMNWL